jgi:diguanylate cyclase (GGDEF)-like protein
VEMRIVEQSTEESRQPNLTAALRIIRNAGLPDPMLQSDDPKAQVQAIIDALCILSTHDGLTGLVNASFFDALLSREINRSLRTGRTCGLMVVDIDHFKQVNDTYGHATGDKALQAVAEQLKLSKRNMDTAARIGGEEFAIILPECSPEDAIAAATRIHSRLNPLILKLEPNILTLTSSAGLVWTNPNMPASSASILAEADGEMYRAKWSGRQRLCYRIPESTMVSGQEQSALMSLRLGDSIHGH